MPQKGTDMSDAHEEVTETGSGNGFKPPYGSFTTLNNLFDRMTDEGGVPARVDRSYLSNLPGSVIATTTHALKQLDLADDGLRPLPTLVEIIEQPKLRKSILAGIIRDKYAAQLALGSRATTAQLEMSFRELGIHGSTTRKAIAFFLAAARYADVPVSPHFKTPKPPATERQPKPRGGRAGQGEQEPPPPPHDARQDALKGVDPFIVGLVNSLPAPGSVFPQETQDAWLETAKGIFKLIYKTGSDSAEARRETSATVEANGN
jgi:hypothetical protein